MIQPSNGVYGKPATVIGNFPILVDEMMLYQYMPIKIAGRPWAYSNLESRLLWALPLIEACIEDYQPDDDDYIYLTAKHVFVSPGNPGNRPGYHCDGFMSNDMNYIWVDKHPTVICVQDYGNIPQDHNVSMECFEVLSKPENEMTHDEFDLIRVDPFVVHRCPYINGQGMRTFVKVSFSKNKYNLVGNTHNYSLPYKWKMYERQTVRNDPAYGEVDFYKQD